MRSKYERLAGSLRYTLVLGFLFLLGCPSGNVYVPPVTLGPSDYSSYRNSPSYGGGSHQWGARPNRPAAYGDPAVWIPKVRSERRWKGIIVHHSLTQEGSAAIFDRFHRVEKKWENGLGYHFVINNGVGKGRADGLVEVGNRWRRQIQGAHTRDTRACCNEYNERHIGICLTGNFDQSRPTAAQYASLAKLISFLQNRYGIPNSQIKGHNAFSPKSCPGTYFSFRELHNRLARL